MKIEIEKLIYEGYGLGHSEDGKAVFVKKSVPGDLLEVEIVKEKKNFAHAIIKSIIEPSAKRIEPRCPHFNRCGGCEHQNIAYSDQLKFKEDILKETLSRFRVDSDVLPIIAGADEPYFYRNTILFSFFVDQDDSISLAMHDYPNFTDLISIDQCFLQSELCNQLITEIKALINDRIADKRSFKFLRIRQGKMTNEFMIELITDNEGLPCKNEFIALIKKHPEIKSFYHDVINSDGKKYRNLLFGSLTIKEKVGRIIYQISPQTFFQTNSLGVKTLYDTIKNFADIKIGETVFDFYCGAGTIGIYLSILAKKVAGVEANQNAINDANANIKLNNIKNAEFICDDASRYIEKIKEDFDVLIFDPPRAGLTKSIIKRASEMKFKRIIYVSCDPATFARDIKEFENFGVKLQKVQPIDMFPQTHHIECVGLLVRQ